MAFITALLKDSAAMGLELPRLYSQVLELFSRHAHTLEEIQEATLVHWNLWPGTIFVIEKNDKMKIEGLIDWERAYWGDSESEPVIAANTTVLPSFRVMAKR